MGWGNVIGGIGALIGGNQAGNAADAQEDAAREALEFQRGVYGDAQGNFAPYLGIGQTGLNGLGALAGGDYSGFMNSPDFLASQKAGIYANDHSAAARGNVFSGGHQVDLNQKMQDHASGYLNNYRNSLMGLAGMGQNAAGSLASAGQGAANGMASGYGALGNAQAAGYGANAGMWGGLLGAIGNGIGGSAYGSTTTQRPPPNQPPLGWGT